MLISNTGSNATATETSVTLSVPSGMTVTFGGKGTFWQCHKHKHSAVCNRNAKISAGADTTIVATVKVTASAGKLLKATATVSPADATPGDNTSTNKVFIHRK